MRDLHTELRDYIESTIERVDVEDVVAAISMGHVPETRSTRRLRPVWAFGAGVAAVLVVLGAVPLLYGTLNDGEPDAAVTIPTTTVATAPTTPVAPTPTQAGPATPLGEAVGSRAFSAVVATDDAVWAAVRGGAIRWDKATGEATVHTDDALPLDAAWQIAEAPNGDIWMGNQGWMARFDGEWTLFEFDKTNPPTGPEGFDAEGNAWSVEPMSAIGRFDGSTWETFALPEPEQSVDPFNLAVAPDGTVWVIAGGSEPEDPTRIIYEFDGETWIAHDELRGIGGYGASIVVDPAGGVWVGPTGTVGDPSAVGIAHFDGTDWRLYTTDDGLLDNLSFVTGAADGVVWASSDGGFSHFDGSSWTAYPDTDIHRPASVDPHGVLWMPTSDGVIGFDGTETVVFDAPSIGQRPAEMAEPAGAWNPILAETVAREEPATVDCPTTSEGDASVPRSRQATGWAGLLSGVFDAATGNVLFVDKSGGTWAFDVCTNTWSALTPDGSPWTSTGRERFYQGFVYDADSARTIGLGYSGNVAVFDSDENVWEFRSHERVGETLGVVYHPPSGLVATMIDGSLWTYDVEGDAWTEVGEPSFGSAEWAELLGYVASIDRFLFVTSGMTGLVDPETGETTMMFTETPTVDLGWPNAQYGPANGTVYVTTHGPNGMSLCGFNTSTLSWDCYDTSGATDSDIAAFGAIVDDPINDRVLLIHRIYGNWWVNSEGAVWSLDPDTGEWNRILDPVED